MSLVGLKLGVGSTAASMEALLKAYGVTLLVPPSAQGLATQAEVFEKADLILVDKELYAVPGDDSGLTIAGDLHAKGNPVVLMVRHVPKDERDFDLLRTGAIHGLINRSLPVGEWPPCVAAYRAGNRFPNCLAQIGLLQADDQETVSIWEEMSDRLGSPGDRSVADECCVLLRRLIAPCATTVALRRIPGGQSGATVLRARVSFGDGPMAEDLAIKYGKRDRIRREAMHYDRYVGPLPDGVAAQLRWRSETHRFGGLAYSWVGDSVEDGDPLGPLADNARPVDWRRRQSTIDRLFRVSLSPWYEAFRRWKSPSKRSLKELYLSENGIFRTTDELGVGENAPRTDVCESHVDTSDPAWWTFVLEDGASRPNPVTWAKAGPTSKMVPQRLAPSHGDLHVRNVYVLPDSSPRLIDFGDTGVHHVFRDFAALEASVRLTCIKDSDLAALSAMEKRVNGGWDLSHTMPLDGLGGSRDLREALRTTEIIRKAAQEVCGYHGEPRENLREYLYAVVVHMLRYASGKADELGEEWQKRERVRVWHAMYAATLAAECAIRLEGNGDRAGSRL